MTQIRLSWPNRITIMRILLIVPFVVAMLHLKDERFMPWARYTALIIFAIAAVSDGLDGYLARRYKNITLLGKFLDPLADKLLITCSVLLLAIPSTALPGLELPDIVVVLIIGKDIYTTLGFVIIYLITAEIKIVPAATGKLSTTLQLTMVIAMLFSPDICRSWPDFHYVIKAFWWAVSAAAILTVITYTRNGTRYLNEFEHRRQNTPPQNI